MSLFWMILLATFGSAVALINDSAVPPHVQDLGVSTPRPATAGWDFDDFPETLLNDNSWENLKCKGDNLNKAMHSNDVEAGKLFNPPLLSVESQWDDFDLSGWYWHQDTSHEATMMNFLDDTDEQPGFGLGQALYALGLPYVQSDDPNTGIHVIYVAHADYSLSERHHDDPKYLSIDDQTYNAGRTYRATGGYYKFGVETATGAIFGLDRLAPEKAAAERKPPVPKDEMPSLQRFSDIAWLFWAKHAANKNKLKYLLNIAVTNSETQQAIRRALHNVNHEFGPWPGTTFDIDSNEGKVLLGSPNGRAYGYLLTQHKALLGGNMYISKITVFHGDTEPFIPNMIFHVEQPKSPTKRLMKKRSLRRGKVSL